MSQADVMADLMQDIRAAKRLIFSAQDNAPLCLSGKCLDSVSFSLTAMRGALEQLQGTLIEIRDGHHAG